jgi:phosphopantothenate synthetase
MSKPKIVIDTHSGAITRPWSRRVTTDDGTIVAGAYETVALEQPLITYNWNPLRRYFYKGTIHVPEDIIQAIRQAQDEKEELRGQMRQLKVEKINDYRRKIYEFKNLLNQSRLHTTLEEQASTFNYLTSFYAAVKSAERYSRL